MLKGRKRKTVLYSLALIFVITAFLPLWVELTQILLVRYIFSNFITSSIIFDVFYIVIIVVSFIASIFTIDNEFVERSIVRYKEKEPEYNIAPSFYYRLVLFISILLIYSSQRISESDFIFYKIFGNQSSIAYLDLFFLLLLFTSVYYLMRLKNSLEYLNGGISEVANQLLEDIPLESENEDALEGLYKQTGQKILNIIYKNSFQKAFTVGLNGKWGDGKSSIFNLIKKEIYTKNNEKDTSYKNIKIIDFSPWNSFDSKIIVKDFFNAIADVVDKNYSSDLKDYANQLINNEYNNDYFQFIKSIFYKDKSLERRFYELNNKIKISGHKLVVFIDDLDRLDKEEIFEVLKLIRKTANFSNFFFIIAYDREYVSNSLLNYNPSVSTEYLDKIINVEINLPYFDKSKLFTFFLEEIDKMDLGDTVVYFKNTYSKSKEKIDFIYWIQNFREVKKILNSIKVLYQIKEYNLSLYDLVNLEILRMKHPILYKILYERKDHLFDIDPTHQIYFLGTKGDFGRDRIINNKSEERRESILHEYLEEYYLKYNISISNQKQIFRLILKLFPIGNINEWVVARGEPSKESSRLLNSVYYPSNYEKYFAHILPENVLDNSDFIQLECETDNKKLIKYISQLYLYKEKDFIFRIKNIGKFQSLNHFQNYIRAAFYLINKTDRPNTNNSLLSKVSATINNPIVDHVEENKLKTVISDFFKDLSLNYIFIGTRILEDQKEALEIKHTADSSLFPFTFKEISEIQESYVLKNLESDKMIDTEFWVLYLYSKKNNNLVNSKLPEIHNKIVLKTDKIDMFKSFVNSLFDDKTPVWKSTEELKEGVQQIFGSFTEFENRLNKLRKYNKDTVNKYERFYEDLNESELTERLKSGEIKSSKI